MERLIKGVVCYGQQSSVPNNAYVVEDYPYGKLRCRKAHWIEVCTKGDKKGNVRLVTCTSNPKKDQIYNKPYYTSYTDVIALYISDAGIDKGKVLYDQLYWGFPPSRFHSFRIRWQNQLDSDTIQQLERAEGIARRYNIAEWREWDAAQLNIKAI